MPSLCIALEGVYRLGSREEPNLILSFLGMSFSSRDTIDGRRIRRGVTALTLRAMRAPRHHEPCVQLSFLASHPAFSLAALAEEGPRDRGGWGAAGASGASGARYFALC